MEPPHGESFTLLQATITRPIQASHRHQQVLFCVLISIGLVLAWVVVWFVMKDLAASAAEEQKLDQEEQARKAREDALEGETGTDAGIEPSESVAGPRGQTAADVLRRGGGTLSNPRGDDINPKTGLPKRYHRERLTWTFIFVTATGSVGRYFASETLIVNYIHLKRAFDIATGVDKPGQSQFDLRYNAFFAVFAIPNLVTPILFGVLADNYG